MYVKFLSIKVIVIKYKYVPFDFNADAGVKGVICGI